ncbi:acetyltransferase [Thozetella sp. PMI_491]|nr:acetyltransferase [Thozetella sp. PMI_491]
MAQPLQTGAKAEGRPRVNFVIQPAVAEDIDAAAAIAGAAFKTDTHTQLKALFDGPNAQADGKGGALKAWLNHPKIDILVAKDVDAGRMLGWIAWCRRGYEGDVDLPMDPPADLPPADTPKTIALLKERSNHAVVKWSIDFMPEGCRCRFIISLVVDPSYQGMGIGSQLMKWGTEKADKEGVYCWVSSSMGAKAAYEKAGFRVVGKEEEVLDDYAEGKQRKEADGTDEPWGTYVWWYMKREPLC